MRILEILFKNTQKSLDDIFQYRVVPNITQKDLNTAISAIVDKVIDVKDTTATYTSNKLNGTTLVAKKIVALKYDQYYKCLRKIVRLMPYFFSWLGGDVTSFKLIIEKDKYFVKIAKNGYALKNVPPRLRDKSICLVAVRQNGLMLQDVPDDTLIDREICLVAVRQNGFALQFVLDNVEDYKAICLAAVTQNGYALMYVPDNLKNKDIYFAAVRQNGLMLQDVPINLRDRNMYLIAIEGGYELKNVPDIMRDREICFAAVRQNGFALMDVPDYLKDNLQFAADGSKRNL